VTQRVVAVLSGGGAKAAAHLGAMRALLAAGIVPTHYVGTSMGAVIASGLAGGLTPDQGAERLLAVRQRDIFAIDRTALLRGLWSRALLRPEPFRKTLEGLLPVARFEDLRVPLSVTATDLDSGEELVFGAGGENVPLLDALCASCALPLFFPPLSSTAGAAPMAGSAPSCRSPWRRGSPPISWSQSTSARVSTCCPRSVPAPSHRR